MHPIVGSNDPKPDPIYASQRLAFNPKCALSARECIAQYRLKFQIIHSICFLDPPPSHGLCMVLDIILTRKFKMANVLIMKVTQSPWSRPSSPTTCKLPRTTAIVPASCTSYLSSNKKNHQTGEMIYYAFLSRDDDNPRRVY